MRCRQSGFGLLEVTLALAIGLMVVVAAGQLLVSAHQSWRLQGAALRLQDDARLALLRMAQDIRMAGMFGCLRLEPADFQDPAARQVFNQPVEVGPASLGLVVAEPSGHAGLPDWTILTDCIEKVSVHSKRPENPLKLMAIPVSHHRYLLDGSTLKLKRHNRNPQPMVDHVREWRIERVESSEGQRIDMQLTLYEPTLMLEQRHELSVALRNPVPMP
ncbi:PilW family protein [Pseudomonas sp. NBRC 111130]|uniref:PilW family protein n=1 Tax=Pseudomonas sp. NBRC 111130 TaxID=1661045 RepID=UPI0006D3B89C|nr:prepilin-type N-terminal cleavage/methylation domain-containing protein [Pseudomonas sp. NBRC 111130]